MPATILIVEDEPDLIKVLRSYLEQAGFSVLTAHRGDSGLRTWEQAQPDERFHRTEPAPGRDDRFRTGPDKRVDLGG